MELIRGHRVALIRKCKLEEIALPLANNQSLAEVSLSQFDV